MNSWIDGWLDGWMSGGRVDGCSSCTVSCLFSQMSGFPNKEFLERMMEEKILDPTVFLVVMWELRC